MSQDGIAPLVETLGSTRALPAEVLAKIPLRLRIVSMVFLGTFIPAYCFAWKFTPAPMMPPAGRVLGHIGACLAILSSVAVVSFTKRFADRPRTLLTVGLAYELSASFAILLAESAMPWRSFDIPRGTSWVVYWILVFAVVVPVEPRRKAIASVGAATLSIVALYLGTIVEGNSWPSASQLVLIVFPNFLAAVTGVALSKNVHALGVQIADAKRLGSYQLVEKLGQGGMGEVWRATHRRLLRPAAVKLIRIKGTIAEVETQRFEREAQTTAMLTSPHTVQLYDFGHSKDGTYYYAMELLGGKNLEELVENGGPISASRAIHILVQICKSLEEAHARGLVHRDIKPANIILCRQGLQFDFAKVLDFGLVRQSNTIPNDAVELTLSPSATPQLTLDGVISGTPAYMPPEQASGRGPIDARSDLYSVGCVAYYLLAGREPFQAETTMLMLMAHIVEVPKPLSDMPNQLEKAVMRCLEKSPAARPQSALELRLLLQQAASEHAPWTEGDARSSWVSNQERLSFVEEGVLPTEREILISS